MIKIGEKIKDFKFRAYHGGKDIEMKLSQFRGRWLILLFYPADFTFICPTELEEAADMYDEFKKLGVEIVSVSADTVFVHKAWHNESSAIKKIKFPMAADPTGKMCAASMSRSCKPVTQHLRSYATITFRRKSLSRAKRDTFVTTRLRSGGIAARSRSVTASNRPTFESNEDTAASAPLSCKLSQFKQ